MRGLIGRAGFIGKFRLVLAALMLAVSFNSSAGVNLKQGKWKDGKIVWYFNASQMPASLKADEFVALTKRAFDIWSAGCKLSVEYGGTTSVERTDARSVDMVVVQFAHLGSGVGGDGGQWSNDAASNFYYFTGGMVAIGADLTPYNLASDRLLYILVHEVGHLLNLAHSDEPYSVMYANPYVAIQSATEPYKAFADDLTTCANLYGGTGIQPTRDYAAEPFVADATYGLRAGVGNMMNFDGGQLIATGSAQDIWQSADPDAVDLSQVLNSPWLRVGWKQPLASLATIRIIAPSGDIVFDNYTISTPANILDGYFPFRWGINVNGLWKMQAFVGGKPAAETQFRTTNGVSSPPKLEVAAIVESGATGNMALRLANYSKVGIASSAAFLNSDYAKEIQSFKPAAGKNTIELWAESNLPRYRAGQGCGQPGSSSDLTRQLALSADSQGKLFGDSIEIAESGTLIAYSAKANIQSAASGTVNVYVAGLSKDVLLFRQADGSWSSNRAALFSFSAPGVANFDILRDVDTRGLPPGTTLVVGHGTSLDDLTANARYKVVRVF